MKRFIKIVVLIVLAISYFIVFVMGIIGFIDDIFGSAVIEKMLQKIHIPWTLNQVFIFAYVSLAVAVILTIIYERFLSD